MLRRVQKKRKRELWKTALLFALPPTFIVSVTVLGARTFITRNRPQPKIERPRDSKNIPSSPQPTRTSWTTIKSMFGFDTIREASETETHFPNELIVTQKVINPQNETLNQRPTSSSPTEPKTTLSEPTPTVALPSTIPSNSKPTPYTQPDTKQTSPSQPTTAQNKTTTIVFAKNTPEKSEQEQAGVTSPNTIPLFQAPPAPNESLAKIEPKNTQPPTPAPSTNTATTSTKTPVPTNNSADSPSKTTVSPRNTASTTVTTDATQVTSALTSVWSTINQELSSFFSWLWQKITLLVSQVWIFFKRLFS